MKNVIKVENLTKNYGERVAVNNISFNIKHGETVGFLGPNGAGKSTTMRMLTGFMMPTQGEVWVADLNMTQYPMETKKKIGYLPEIVPLYTDMTTRRYLEFAGKIRGLSKQSLSQRIEEVVTTCALEEYFNVILAKLSKGYRQRVGLAQAIIHNPEVLILDEPTIGIDPNQVAQTRQLIKELGKNRTILISSHILSEISMICDSVIIIQQGKIVAQDRLDQLSSKIVKKDRLRLSITGPKQEIIDCLKKVTMIESVLYEDPFYLVEFPLGREPQTEIVSKIVENNWQLKTMEKVDTSLEDVFLQLTSNERKEM